MNARHNVVPEDMTYLELLLRVCDYRAAVHLGARSYHCEHASDRNYPVVDALHPEVILLPWVGVAVR